MSESLSVLQLTVYEQGLVSLILSALTPPGGAFAASYISLQQQITDLFKIAARTAYVVSDPAEKVPASSKAQVSVMLANLAAGMAC
jgi:hypothetical protein